MYITNTQASNVKVQMSFYKIHNEMASFSVDFYLFVVYREKTKMVSFLIKDFLILLLHSIMIPFFNSQYLFPKFQTPKAAMRICIHFTLSLENSASLECMAKDDEHCRLLLTRKIMLGI